MSFSGIERWFVEQMVPVFFVGFALLAGLALVYFSAQSKKSVKVRDRVGKDEETFAEQLVAYGFDAEIARTVYRYLQEQVKPGFPLLPADDLDRDLGLDRDDVRGALRELTALVGREYLPGLVMVPIATVAELVRAVQTSPRTVQPTRRRA